MDEEYREHPDQDELALRAQWLLREYGMPGEYQERDDDDREND